MNLLIAAALLVCQETDFSKIERKLHSEPTYESKPGYALIVFGTDLKSRLWMSIDVKGAEDIVYVDVDGDGRLGEDGERFSGSRDRDERLTVIVGKVERKDEKLLVEDFEISTRGGKWSAVPRVFMSFRVNGKLKVTGGYGPRYDIGPWGKSPAEAPILHVDPWGTLGFYHENPTAMKIGGEDDLKLFVGNWGAGATSFMAVDESFLDLEKDRLLVTLIARDAKGNEIRKQFQLKEHC